MKGGRGCEEDADINLIKIKKRKRYRDLERQTDRKTRFRNGGETRERQSERDKEIERESAEKGKSCHRSAHSGHSLGCCQLHISCKN